MSAILSGLGRIGNDPEVRYTQSGEAVVSLSLAFPYGRRGEDGNRPTTWIEAAIWGKRAESLAPYLKRGGRVWVALSDIQLKSYTTRDGQTASKIAGRVMEIELAGERSASGDDAPTRRPSSAHAQPAAPADDDIPF
ncbi:MAG: single-stranded DNA-binding protein [Rhodocyclaceae bacterium]